MYCWLWYDKCVAYFNTFDWLHICTDIMDANEYVCMYVCMYAYVVIPALLPSSRFLCTTQIGDCSDGI